VRRLVALFVLALVGAGLYGLSGASSGVTVNDARLSATTLDAELQAISHHDDLECYVTALDPTNYAPGAGGDSVKASGAAAWTELRVEGLAIDQYVTTRLHYTPGAAQLASAESSLEGEMTEQAKANSLSCPGTSAQALTEMPAEMRAAEVESQATSLYLVEKLKKAVPLTPASVKSYYDAHTADYDTLCVSIALVPPSKLSAFSKAQSAGASVATLAGEFSADSSAAKGGAYGCYPPSNSAYTSVRSDVATLPLDTFATTPQYIEYDGGEYGLFVAVTKRSVTPFASASPAVLTDLQNLNASAANSVKNDLLYEAAVHVDPAFGRWGLNTSGPQVFAVATPAASDVTGAKDLAGSAATYK
jgi:hypothetical protein